MKATIETAISAFGASAKAKLANPSAIGQPEDQIRAPFEELLKAIAELSGLGRSAVVPVGETAQADLKTRPDYSVTVHNALVGFVELKAPGKGADPTKFKDPHDKTQWEKLRSLPNLLYTDGNAFSLWQDGKIVDKVLTCNGDIETAGAKLSPPPGLHLLFESFLGWKPIAPSSAKELAHTAARLCHFLRDEVTEQLSLKSEGLTALATDWRKLLFPDATDERFADGYAQAVTFGMLMARAKGIPLGDGLEHAASELTKTSSLIGTALRLLTESEDNRATLKTSLNTLTRVLDAVDWSKISKGDPDAWLYFYEEFLAVYDNELRKQTGSYYTPPQVVSSMVALVDEALRGDQFNLHGGLAAPSVTLADPATGTGTFMLGILRRIAQRVREDEGEGAVPAAIHAALKRLIAFEMQLGPFAVAQLRILAEVVDLTGTPSDLPLRMFVTDTLSDPYNEAEWFPGFLAAIGKSRREANQIKLKETITVVIGNPPYKEKAMGLGGWIEHKTANSKEAAPLEAWMPPKEWKTGVHSKHLRNLYIYFWRWATWKVFDQSADHNTGIVCFITVAGFLNGKGLQKMRDYLRRTCDNIWVVDCSPDGYQPGVNTRIFQAVQQPVCIVMAARSKQSKPETPAKVLFRSLPLGNRELKFAALKELRLKSEDWIECPTEWRSPFLPKSQEAWSTYPALVELFIYHGSGVMPGRTWVIAPDADSLERRWAKLKSVPVAEMDNYFQPHMDGDNLGDRHSAKVLKDSLHGFPLRIKSVAYVRNPDDPKMLEPDAMIPPIRYGFRSFDRQWIIPDKRLINRPNPELWLVRSTSQIYMTAFTEESPSSGPALTFTGLIPDLHHYRGSFGGRAFPLWRDGSAAEPNIKSGIGSMLRTRYGCPVDAEDVFAYVAAVAANPAYTARFQGDLSTPGLRVPLTADAKLFAETVEVGRRVLWLHTFGERMVDPAHGRAPGPPRVTKDMEPSNPKEGTISSAPEDMPNIIGYDAEKHHLLVGHGFMNNVLPAVWKYEVSGKQILLQWFSYRKHDRERPVMGDRRPPSPLGDIRPDHWLPEYTTELLNVLRVLTLLVELEPKQADLLERICIGPLISEADLRAAGALDITATTPKATKPKKEKPLRIEFPDSQS
jgi:hypothetical protein